MRNRYWATVGVALLMGGLSSAVSVRPLSLQELCNGSEDIVYARVQKVDSYWRDQKIETLVTLASFETWKGAAAPSVQVRVPGGTVGAITMRCCEAPVFKKGEDVVCFLKTREGAKEVYGWFRGQYTVVNQRIREMPSTTLASLKASVQTAVQASVEAPVEEGR
jgi:hypothetical protein